MTICRHFFKPQWTRWGDAPQTGLRDGSR